VSVLLSKLGPSTFSPASECGSPKDPRGGCDTLAGRGRGWGGPNFDEGTETLVLYVYYDPSTIVTL
jgi:hypothetical protein